MFVFVATALAATTIVGWPCQRLNWGWRNVWSTCSINSYVPAGSAETLSTIPTHYRFTTTAPLQPSSLMDATTGVFTPTATTAALPALLCTNAANTGSGFTANLRNRCRRAIDAYGQLVKTCIAPPSVVPPKYRTPNSLSPDYEPQVGHLPHVSNVKGLTVNAQFCVLPPSTAVHATPELNTPANTCPGLLGWFTVVFNTCGFTNAPGLHPSQQPNTPYTANYFPIGDVAHPNVLTDGRPIIPSVPSGIAGGAGYFCGPYAVGASATPGAWNAVGTTFRTSRCRKALDQFGRTAKRCHFSTTPATGPAQAGGYSDPLRVLAVGTSTLNAPQTPNGINVWGPTCN